MHGPVAPAALTRGEPELERVGDGIAANEDDAETDVESNTGDNVHVPTADALAPTRLDTVTAALGVGTAAVSPNTRMPSCAAYVAHAPDANL